MRCFDWQQTGSKQNGGLERNQLISHTPRFQSKNAHTPQNMEYPTTQRPTSSESIRLPEPPPFARVSRTGGNFHTAVQSKPRKTSSEFLLLAVPAEEVQGVGNADVGRRNEHAARRTRELSDDIPWSLFPYKEAACGALKRILRSMILSAFWCRFGKCNRGRREHPSKTNMRTPPILTTHHFSQCIRSPHLQNYCLLSCSGCRRDHPLQHQDRSAKWLEQPLAPPKRHAAALLPLS